MLEQHDTRDGQPATGLAADRAGSDRRPSREKRTRAGRANADASSEFLFREVNERIAELTSSADSDLGLFICECSSDACTEAVEITVPEYEAIRAYGDRFVVLPGHQRRELDCVVDGNGRFLVVAKIDGPGEAARERDPRAS